jgi:ADP-ribose pyrophosphatase YjhB (NUDIX family)
MHPNQSNDTKSMPDPSQLTQFPRPSVAVDTAVLCPVPGRGLHVLITHPGDGVWQLPGSILRPQERLAEAVARCLREKARLVDRAPVQLHVFDQPDRDDRGWVISVAHLDVLSARDVGFDTAPAEGSAPGRPFRSCRISPPPPPRRPPGIPITLTPPSTAGSSCPCTRSMSSVPSIGRSCAWPSTGCGRCTSAHPDPIRSARE